jgi:mannose-6-phosphate isomerase-like protein (cupin superfamily)
MSTHTENTSVNWIVRHVDECPVDAIEGVKLRRVLSGTAFDTVGCEYVAMAPGQVLAPHVHCKAHSFILIIAGHGIVSIDGRDFPIGPGYTIYIPAGIAHGFRTLDEELVLYGFQSPPIIQDTREVDLVFHATASSPDLIAVNA